jgi:hypothetical protein
MITIRHRIPLRERITSDSNHTENTDTEGEHPRHCPVRWGLPLAAARPISPCRRWTSTSTSNGVRRWTRTNNGVSARTRDSAIGGSSRYCDDFVLVVFGERHHAEALREEASAVLASLGLRLAPEKTHVVHIDEGFTFLGFDIRRMRK